MASLPFVAVVILAAGVVIAKGGDNDRDVQERDLLALPALRGAESRRRDLPALRHGDTYRSEIDGRLKTLPGGDLSPLSTAALPILVATPTPLPDLPPASALPYVEPPPIDVCSGYAWSCAQAEAVVSCESGWNAAAISWDGSSFGLWQIWSGHAWRWSDFWESWTDPVQNTAWAYELWLEQDWWPWTCRP